MSTGAHYGVKDALLGLFVGLFMGGLSGFGLYALSPERLHCERAGTNQGDCVLSRRMLGVPVRYTRMTAVTGATLEEYYSAPRTSTFNTRQDPGGRTYFVRYDTATGPVHGAEGPARAEHQAIVTGLHVFLDDGDALTYDMGLGGGPLLWRVALGVLFVVGAACLVNIPFAVIRTLRARWVSERAIHNGVAS